MNPQIVQYINSLTARINSVQDCRSLTVLEQEILANMEALLASTLQQIEVLTPFTEIPTNLEQALAWIENYIGLNFIVPLQNALLLEAQLVTAIAQLTEAINAKYGELSCLYNPLATIQSMGNQLVGQALTGGG